MIRLVLLDYQGPKTLPFLLSTSSLVHALRPHLSLGDIIYPTHRWSPVMVSFMCQLVWTTLSRYFVKHYSRCFCEGMFLDEINLDYWTLSKADLLL